MDKDSFYIVDDGINFIDERKRPSWIKDDLSNKCFICEKTFSTFTRRRHHCRSCGGVFCYECSNNFICIPNFIGNMPKPEYNPLDIKTYIPSTLRSKTLEVLGYNVKEERVCSICYKRIQNVNKISDLIRIFNNIVLDINCYKKMACVCKSWNKVAIFYLQQIQQIQYYLPDQPLTERDKKMLWINRRYFIGHTKWLVPLIRSIDWKKLSVRYKQELINIITNNNRVVDCNFLCCGHNCMCSLSSEDSVICLYPVISQKEIRNYIFKQLINASIDELLCYLPYLVYNIRFYYNRARNKCNISNLLIHISTQNFTFLNFFFWELNIQMMDCEHQNMYNSIKILLLDRISEDNKHVLLNSESFIKSINNIFKSSNNVELLKDLVRDHLLKQEYFRDYPVSLPIDPSHLVIGVSQDGINVKQSATCPIEIPLNCIKRIDKNNHSIYSFCALFKHEDVRKDYIVGKIIMLMDLIISKKLQIDLELVHYNILPITETSGFVEMVADCDTIYNIHEKFKFTIQNFITENNSDKTVGELRDKFVKTCAGYCVITYLLGIGDRHLDNIMLTRDGRLFHIDFSYILGYDPKVFGSEIRLTNDMIDMMGGFESKDYKYFVELCNTCYNSIRQHSNLFYLLLGMLNNYKPVIDGQNKFSKTKIEKHIVDKFMPFESNYEAKIHIENKVASNTHETLGTSISDLFHYYNKETGSIFKKLWS
jgi:phosphatidylinositol 3-kinase